MQMKSSTKDLCVTAIWGPGRKISEVCSNGFC